MLIKWLVATVPAPQRRAFSSSQQAWAPLSHCEGFLGQVGGWDQDGRGCIIGLWRDTATYDRFMALAHDAILAQSSGPPPFSKLDIELSHSIVRYAGTAAHLAAALERARWLRVQDCTVHADHTMDFVAGALQTRPARLAASSAFCAGSTSVGDGRRFFETTLWDTADVPAGPLPTVRSSKTPDAPLTRLTAHRVALEPSWTLLPT